MIVEIFDSREGGGGHKSFDFKLKIPKDGIKQSQTFQKGVQLEKKIFGIELEKSFNKKTVN